MAPAAPSRAVRLEAAGAPRVRAPAHASELRIALLAVFGLAALAVWLRPLFFVWLGASVDLRDLGTHPSALGLGICLGAGAILVHVTMVLTGQPRTLATLAAAQLGIPVAAVTLGGQLGLLAPGEGAALLLGAVVTIAGVALAGRALRRAVALP